MAICEDEIPALRWYKEAYHEGRSVIELSLKKIIEGLESSDDHFKIYFLEAPTGYGKTAVPYFLAMHSLERADQFLKVVHALPLRSIILQSYEKFGEVLEKLGLGTHPKLASIQMMGKHVTHYFEALYTVTTFDTFLLSLFKLNPTQYGKVKKGYAGKGYFTYGHDFHTQASLINSFIVFDEVQLALGMTKRENEKRYSLPRVFRTAIKVLVAFKTPFLIMSATLPAPLREEICGDPESDIVCDIVPAKSRDIYRRDKFYKKMLGKVKSERLDGKFDVREICDLALESFKEGKRVATIFNTPSNAIKAFKHLKEEVGEENLVLLHGRLSEKDKEYYLRKLRELEGKECLVVSTQVIEAGVDLSVGAMYSEESPLENLIQRAGRVARRPGEKGEFYVFSLKKPSKVYDRALVEKSLELFSEIYDIKDPARYGPKIDELWEYVDLGGGISHGLKNLALSLHGRSIHMEEIIEGAVKEEGGFLREALVSCEIEGSPEDSLLLSLSTCWRLYKRDKLKIYLKTPSSQRELGKENYRQLLEGYLKGNLMVKVKEYEKGVGIRPPFVRRSLMEQCYSFWESQKKYELMEDHIRRGIEILEEDFLRRSYGKFIENRAKRANLDVPWDGGVLLKISYIFHDVGKGLRFYQERRSFNGHEVLSSAIFYCMLKEELKMEEKESIILSMPILLHHHTMDLKGRVEYVLRSIGGKISLDHDLTACCKKIVQDFIKDANVEISEEFWGKKVEIPSWIIEYATGGRNFSRPSGKEISFIYAVLYPLCIADWTSAQLNRRDRKTNE